MRIDEVSPLLAGNLDMLGSLRALRASRSLYLIALWTELLCAKARRYSVDPTTHDGQHYEENHEKEEPAYFHV